MTTHSKLIYALKDGNIVSIADVPSGKKCGCVCPACGDELIARKGEKRMHHFAHRSNEDCEYGYESSLHLAAKDILSRSEKMVIPPVYVEFPQSGKPKELISKERKIPIDDVELEKRFDDIIPDIVVDSGDEHFFIEIYVTHPIDDEKLKKLKEKNISTIEIDLSKIKRDISVEELSDILLKSSDRKSWKYNAVSEKWYQRFEKACDRDCKLLYRRESWASEPCGAGEICQGGNLGGRRSARVANTVFLMPMKDTFCVPGENGLQQEKIFSFPKRNEFPTAITHCRRLKNALIVKCS